MKLEDVRLGQTLRIVKLADGINLEEDGIYLRGLVGQMFKVQEIGVNPLFPVRLEGEPYYCWKAEELEIVTEKELREIEINKEIESLKAQLQDLEEEKEEIRWSEKVVIAKAIGTESVKVNLISDVDELQFLTGDGQYSKDEEQTYYRHRNSIICEIRKPMGGVVYSGRGIVELHPEDTFDYITGMIIAEAKAHENLYANYRRKLIKDTYK